MRSASLIINRSLCLALALLFVSAIFAQENSPYSRYGLGDVYPQQNISSRSMGGLSAPLSEWQVVNTTNPASYGDVRPLANGGLVTLDLGVSIDARSLRSANPVSKYNSANFIPSYFQFAAPLGRKHWGIAFGLKPITRINYSIEQKSNKIFNTGFTDSVQNLYEGSGGLNQVFLGIGKKFGNFSIGLNGGYNFGRREISSKVNLLNDTVAYQSSNTANTTTFGGFSFQGGLQYQLKLSDVKDNLSGQRNLTYIRFGLSGMLQHQLHAKSEKLDETFTYNADGAVIPIDTVYYQENQTGDIKMPASYSAGFMLFKSVNDPLLYKWGIGIEYDVTNWAKDYRLFGQPDVLNNSSMIRIGGMITPNPISGKGLWDRATYKAGFYTGKDYINADGNGLKVSAFTFGAAFQLRPARAASYNNEYTLLNTAFEIGRRGTGVNNITESFFKFSVGFSLSDIWFIKRKYD